MKKFEPDLELQCKLDAVRLLVAVFDVVHGEVMRLRAVGFHHVCGDHAREPRARFDGKTHENAFDVPRTIRIACARRVHKRLRRARLHVRRAGGRNDVGAFRAVRDDDGRYLAYDLLLRPARLLFDELEFVIASEEHVRARYAVAEHFLRESRDLLRGVVQIAEGAFSIVSRQRLHIGHAAGSDDGERAALRRDGHVICRAARALMERRNLVIGFVGEYERGGGSLFFQNADRLWVNAREKHVRTVRTEVIARRRYYFGLFAQKREIVCDVTGGAAELHRDRFHLKAEVDAVELLGHEMLGEEARKIHDAVVGNRARDNHF